MARKRKIKSVKELLKLWNDYKAYCDSRTATLSTFSSAKGEYITREVHKPATYSITGFCIFIGLSRQAFDKYYAKDETYVDIVNRLKDECEIDARYKFESGQIPSRIAGLWMSKYNYSTKTEAENMKNSASALLTMTKYMIESGNDEDVEDFDAIKTMLNDLPASVKELKARDLIEFEDTTETDKLIYGENNEQNN